MRNKNWCYGPISSKVFIFLSDSIYCPMNFCEKNLIWTKCNLFWKFQNRSNLPPFWCTIRTSLLLVCNELRRRLGTCDFRLDSSCFALPWFIQNAGKEHFAWTSKLNLKRFTSKQDKSHKAKSHIPESTSQLWACQSCDQWHGLTTRKQESQGFKNS